MSYSVELEISDCDGGDIPFITEIDVPSSSPSISRSHSNKCSIYGRSASHSRSPSFRDDGQILLAARYYRTRTSSFDDELFRCKRNGSHRRSHHSHAGEYDSRRAIKRKSSSNSMRSSRRSRYSNASDIERRYSAVSLSQKRRNSSGRQSKLSRHEMEAVTVVDHAKEMKRRWVVYVIGGTFLFILFCSVLAVIITLTHQSTLLSENKTMIYYTFSPDASIIVHENQQYLLQNVSRSSEGK